MTEHGQSVGGQGTQDGIAGSRSGTEGATSGQGVDKGAQQKDPRKDDQQICPAFGRPAAWAVTVRITANQATPA